MLGDYESTTRTPSSSTDVAERLGLEIDSLLKTIDNDLTKFKDDFTQDLDPVEASAQADEAMAQALRDGELKPNVEPTATASPVEVVTGPESAADPEADPPTAAEDTSDPEASAERVLEDVSESATTPTPAVPAAMVDHGETAGDEVDPPEIDPPAAESPPKVTSSDTPIVDPQGAESEMSPTPSAEVAAEEAGKEAEVSSSDSDTEAVEETPTAPTADTPPADPDSADSSSITAPVAADAVDNPSSLANDDAEALEPSSETAVIPIDQDSVSTGDAPTEPEAEAEPEPDPSTVEPVPAADLEELDRMLADAAEEAAVAPDGDPDAIASIPTAPPTLTPASSFDDSSDHNLDSSTQSTSVQTSEATPAVTTTASPQATSPTATESDSANITENAEGVVSPSGASESKIRRFIAELKGMLWARVPLPVQGFIEQALKVYQAIPYREKPAEWLLLGLAQINRPWQKLSADLQFGLLTISIASLGLGIVALAIVWMRSG